MVEFEGDIEELEMREAGAGLVILGLGFEPLGYTWRILMYRCQNGPEGIRDKFVLFARFEASLKVMHYLFAKDSLSIISI